MREARRRLAARQQALVEALVADGKPPAGFDPARLAAAAEVLARKRAHRRRRGWLARLVKQLADR